VTGGFAGVDIASLPQK